MTVAIALLSFPRLQLLHGLSFRDAEPAVSIVDTYLDDANCTLTSHNYCQISMRTCWQMESTRLFIKRLTIRCTPVSFWKFARASSPR